MFCGKPFYRALALLPPTIPVVILGLAMLSFLSRVNLSGQLHAVIISHVVMCAPFAMAIVRLRLSQMDPSLEAAAWNLGASEWMALRSEEHTSELQSLMRISYAVFCLKKQKNTTPTMIVNS